MMRDKHFEIETKELSAREAEALIAAKDDIVRKRIRKWLQKSE